MKPLRVYKWCDGEWYDTDEADARIAALEAERDAARADAERNRVNAERYEWLRLNLSDANGIYADAHGGLSSFGFDCESDDSLDAAIDAARRNDK